MKRFYKTVDTAVEPDGVAVLLDGKPVRTPAKRSLRLPTEALARAVADEWDAQPDEIDPQSMRLTRLANSALDRVSENRAAVVEEIAGYAATDLVCYRATEPEELVRRQAEGWDPLVAWFRDRHGVELVVTDGILPVDQRDEVLQRAHESVAAFDDFVLAGVHMATTASGSVVLGLAVVDGRIGGEAAWELSLIDETWQIEKWGEDPEATRRRTGLLADITAAARFLELCRAGAAP